MTATTRRAILLAAAVVLGGSGASAQGLSAACHPSSPTERVVVRTTDGDTIQGTLVPLGRTLRSAAGWAVIGGTWDALQTNQKTSYSGGPRSMSIAWRVGF